MSHDLRTHSETLRREIVDPALSTHGGRVVKLTGDGILIEFTSAVDAATIR